VPAASASVNPIGERTVPSGPSRSHKKSLLLVRLSNKSLVGVFTRKLYSARCAGWRLSLTVAPRVSEAVLLVATRSAIAKSVRAALPPFSTRKYSPASRVKRLESLLRLPLVRERPLLSTIRQSPETPEVRTSNTSSVLSDRSNRNARERSPGTTETGVGTSSSRGGTWA